MEGGLWENAKGGFLGDDLTAAADGLALVALFAADAQASAEVAAGQALVAAAASKTATAGALTAPNVYAATAAGFAAVAEDKTF